MSTALQLHTETMADWQIIRQQSEVLIKTGFLPQSIKTPEQVMAIILTGRELGIGAMQALNTINVIAGKPTISPQLMLALINRSGELEDFSIADDGQACTVTMKRKERQAHVETFSMKDAALMKTTEGYGDNKKTISLSEKYNWRQQPAVMRKWRAIAACARVVFPDVILGLYTPDEMGAHTDGETGEVATLPSEVGEPAILAICGVCDASLLDSGLCPNCDVVIAGPEPEPVRTVKLEGAQLKANPSNKLPTLKGAAGQITALANTLGWNEKYLREEILARCKVELMDDLAAALPEIPPADAKALIQSMKAELESRNRTR